MRDDTNMDVWALVGFIIVVISGLAMFTGIVLYADRLIYAAVWAVVAVAEVVR
jgi:hypothetical protein